MRSVVRLLSLVSASLAVSAEAAPSGPVTLPIKPDIVVASDGSGDFTSVHAAAQSIPRTNYERRIIFIKDGLYAEKVRIDAAFVTLRGESRTGTTIAYSQPNSAPRDDRGNAVLNLTATAHDFVLENLTVENTHGQLGVHAFAVFGLADRTVIVDCDIISQGNDTLSLWRGRAENAEAVAASMPKGATTIWTDGGRYYHARLKVVGSVDFICPRGWCYMVDSTITQLNPAATAAIWHDGSNHPDKKFVLRNCRFEGPDNWYLARRHHDAQFYLVDCSFSATMRDQAPYRVIYPLNGGVPTEADRGRNAHYDRTNKFGERAYYHNSRRDGGDFAWHRDNLSEAPGAPAPEQITAAWTFAGSWDPERIAGPGIRTVAGKGDRIEITFDEIVTVKGRPRLLLRDGGSVDYIGGSGTTTLVFDAPASGGHVVKVDIDDGAIIATEASARLRLAELSLPSSSL